MSIALDDYLTSNKNDLYIVISFFINHVATFSLFKQTLSKKNPTTATAAATNALGNKAKQEKFVLVGALAVSNS